MFYLKEYLKKDYNEVEKLYKITLFETGEELKDYLDTNFSQIVVKPNPLIDLVSARNEIGWIESGESMFVYYR